MENKIFPFLKLLNEKSKRQLSFSDMLEELKNIKLCVLNLGKNVDSFQITELNELQEKILTLFNMKKHDIDNSL